MRLTESQTYAISNALRIAADRYDANVTHLTNVVRFDLAKQFDNQSKEAHELANIFENAAYIEVGE